MINNYVKNKHSFVRMAFFLTCNLALLTENEGTS